MLTVTTNNTYYGRNPNINVNRNYKHYYRPNPNINVNRNYK